MRHRLFNLLRIVISLGLLAFLLAKVGLRETWESLQGANIGYLLTVFLLYLLSMVLRSYRWRIFLNAQGVRVSLPKLVSLYLIGVFFNLVLPSGFGGDVVRVYELSQYSNRTASSITTVFMDRLSGFLALFAMATSALAFSYRLVPPEVGATIILIFLASLMGTGALFSHPLWRRLKGLPLLSSLVQKGGVKELYLSAQSYTLTPFARAISLSMAFNILLMIMNYLAALSFGVRISFWYFLLFIPIISFLLALPISLSGLGVREGAYIYLFSRVGVPPSSALAISLSIYAVTVATGLIGAFIYAVEGYRGMRGEKGSEDG
ncbi:MAG: lysylphosphatidylglycerol synthase transmembrane domain-containing protein [Anaerolineae bacterium]